jgi:hypothetical protein
MASRELLRAVSKNKMQCAGQFSSLPTTHRLCVDFICHSEKGGRQRGVGFKINFGLTVSHL